MLATHLESLVRASFVSNYDRLMAPLERRMFGEARARLVALAQGIVLDVGAGTGANFSLFGRGARRIVAVDTELGMLAQARPRGASARVPVGLVAASAEALPFADGFFESAVASLVICSVARP